MNDLHDLLKGLADEPTSEPFDPNLLLERGRGRVRRHRVLAAAGISVAAASVVAVSLVVANVPSADGPTPPTHTGTQHPTPPTTPPTTSSGAGQVITIDQAKDAVLGLDYLAVSQQFPANVSETMASDAEGDLLVTQDETYLGTRLSTGRILRLGVIPPGAKTPTWFDSPTGAAFTVFFRSAVTPALVVFGITPGVDDGQPAHVYVTDRSTGMTHQLFGASFLAGGRTFRTDSINDLDLSTDGTVYLSVYDGSTNWLVSAAADHSTPPRLLGSLVEGSYDVDGDVLASLAATGPDAGTVVVRNLATGAHTTIRLPGDQQEHCSPHGISTARDHVVVLVDCGRGTDELYDVYDTAGRHLWTIDTGWGHAAAFPPGSMTDEGMIWESSALDHQRLAGPEYFFAFTGQRFLRFTAYGDIESMRQAGGEIWVALAKPDQPAVFRLTGG